MKDKHSPRAAKAQVNLEPYGEQLVNPRFSGSNPEGGTNLSKKMKIFLMFFVFFKKTYYLYFEIRKKNNKVMRSINKHMNIWANSFKGYCGNSYALVGTDARFDERPHKPEEEYSAC